jgi:hypothetical protein
MQKHAVLAVFTVKEIRAKLHTVMCFLSDFKCVLDVCMFRGYSSVCSGMFVVCCLVLSV